MSDRSKVLIEQQLKDKHLNLILIHTLHILSVYLCYILKGKWQFFMYFQAPSISNEILGLGSLWSPEFQLKFSIHPCQQVIMFGHDFFICTTFERIIFRILEALPVCLMFKSPLTHSWM